MNNEYGKCLDSNGYAPSIITGHDEQRCFLCGRNGSCDKLDRHEIYGGAYRTKSKNLGLWVHLCHNKCHLNGVHKDATKSRLLKRTGQIKAMQEYGWTTDDFIREFGKNYLEE